jgi:uncharacterized membrane protein
MGVQTGSRLPPIIVLAIIWILGWIGGLASLIVELVTQNRDYFIMWHSWQSIIFGFLWTVFVFIPCIIVDAILGATIGFGGFCFGASCVVYFIFACVMVILSYPACETGEERFRLPFIGDFAARMAGSGGGGGGNRV